MKLARNEGLLALSILIPVMIGLGYMLGFDLFRRSVLDIQLHNTYLIVRPWELVLLFSMPLWLLVQLVRGAKYLLTR